LSPGRLATVPDWHAKPVKENTSVKTTAIRLMAFFGKEEYKLPGKEVRVVGVGEVMDNHHAQQEINVRVSLTPRQLLVIIPLAFPRPLVGLLFAL
jgi:hypothetical protein